MHRFRIILASIVVSSVTLIPAAGHADDIQSLTQQAQQAASAGDNSRAFGLYELALTQSAGQPDSIVGPLDGQYWRLVVQTGDFPRALDFFTALAAQQKSPSATVLASHANAIGSYLGWLHQNKLMASVPPATLQQMDTNARGNYDRALALDPDNFAALYGYAIYESYSPNGKTHMRQLLAKLDTLRVAHPNYPWQMVDYLKKNGHPQN